MPVTYFWSVEWQYCLCGFGYVDQGLIFQDPLQEIWPWPQFSKCFDLLCICGALYYSVDHSWKQEKCMTDAMLGFNLSVEKSETYKSYYKTINDTSVSIVLC